MDYIELLQSIREDRVELKNDIRQMISDSNVSLHGKIIDEVEKVEIKVDMIIQNGVRQNGTLARHEKDLNDLKLKDVEFENYQKNCPAAKVTDNWKLSVALLLLSVITINIMYDNINWDKFWNVISRII